jgi:hypothetical protein
MNKHTQDIDDQFPRMFPEACERIGCKPLDLLGVMFSESQCRPAARNPHGNASGLIQFMPDTLRGLGWRDGDQAFRCLSASQQLPYVVAYFTPWQKAGAPWDSAARLYQACFLPGTLTSAREPEDVIAARGGRLGWAFEANSVFDANGDQRITIVELGEAVIRACRGPRWSELLARIGLEAPSVELRDRDGDGMPEIASIMDVQLALAVLNIDPGPIDGLMGPKTRAAIRAFQEANELHADGVAGRETRAALSHALIPA